MFEKFAYKELSVFSVSLLSLSFASLSSSPVGHPDVPLQAFLAWTFHCGEGAVSSHGGLAPPPFHLSPPHTRLSIGMTVHCSVEVSAVKGGATFNFLTPLRWMHCFCLPFTASRVDVVCLCCSFNDPRKRKATRPPSESSQNKVGHSFFPESVYAMC